MYEDDLNLKRKTILTISITSIISALLIYIVGLIKIDSYLKDIIIPFFIMLTSYVFLLKNVKLEKNKKAYWLLIPILLIMISRIIIKIDESNGFLNIIILPIIMQMFFYSLTNKNYKITGRSLWLAFKLFPNKLFYNLKYNKDLFKKKGSKKISNILLGLIIGIPITYVLITLLISSDQYFSEFIKNLTNFIPLTPFNWIDDVIKIGLTFIVLFSIMINIIRNKDLKLERKDYKPINITISSIVLVMMNLVFMVFLISEISKLTTNFLNIPENYTHAQYAREGFFELLLVTSINFIVIFYHVYLTKGLKDNKFIKYMILTLIGFSIILIFNSYYRMFLYINEYSFTVLRLQVILFLLMELVLFGILIKKIVNNLKVKDSLLFIFIPLAFYILNLYLCSGWFIKILDKLVN